MTHSNFYKQAIEAYESNLFQVDHHEVVAIEIQKSATGNYIYTLTIINVEENEPIVMMDVEDLGHTDDYVTGIFGGVVEFRSKSVDAI